MSTQGHVPPPSQAPSSAGIRRLSREKISAETQTQTQSPNSRAERSSSRWPSPGTAACCAQPGWPACLLQRQRLSLPPPPSSVGTFARALDCSSSVRQPSLHMSAAAASRDITLVRGLLRPARPPAGLSVPSSGSPVSHRLRPTCTSWGCPAPSSRPVSGSTSPRRGLTCPGPAPPAHGSLPTLPQRPAAAPCPVAFHT